MVDSPFVAGRRDEHGRRLPIRAGCHRAAAMVQRVQVGDRWTGRLEVAYDHDLPVRPGQRLVCGACRAVLARG